MSSTVVTLASLGAPTLTAPSSIAQDRPFTVRWTVISGATYYVLERNYAGSNYEEIYSGASISTPQSLSITGNYGYRVKACNTTGCGSGSLPASVIVIVGP